MSDVAHSPAKTTALSPPIALAKLGIVSGDPDQVRDSDWLTVHFNPASLQLQVSNELKDGQNNSRKQYIAKTTTKLTFDLQFDTTDTGKDVTENTRKVQFMVSPERPSGQSNTAPQIPPPLVLFLWGRLRFKGIIESYKETIDFFSANGVPLRSSINLTLSRQDAAFDPAPDDAPADAGSVNDDLAIVPASSAADAAHRGGAPGAARDVAAANGQENLRFGAGASIGISASVELKAAVAFSAGASAGAGLSLGAGAGAGIGVGAGAGFSAGASAGFSASASAGFSASASAGFSASAGASAGFSASAGASAGFSASAGAGFSASAGFGASGPSFSSAGAFSVSGSAGLSGLAGLSASEGAFAGLQLTASPVAKSSLRLDTAALTPTVQSASFTTDRGATFQVGGKATVDGSAGLRANVGASGSVRGKLTFEAL